MKTTLSFAGLFAAALFLQSSLVANGPKEGTSSELLIFRAKESGPKKELSSNILVPWRTDSILVLWGDEDEIKKVKGDGN